MGVCINRYVDHNEKLQCLGEDREQNKKLPFESNDQKSYFSHQISMVDNALQRDVSVTARSATRLRQAPSPHYDRLCLSLLSGLPNEQEFALNVCTLMSNEGALHLEHSPKMVELLVAQAGVWLQDAFSLKMLYLESWRDLVGRNMHRFWRSTLNLHNFQLLKLLGLDLGEYDADEDLLNLESDLGMLNSEGQKVLKVALILHNLSFEKNNVPVLVHSSVFIRFLLLSVHSSWANLRQTAYDTLANIAYEIELRLEQDSCSHLLFQTVIEGVQSPDRFMSIRSMDILSQLCSCDPNEDIIPSRLDVRIYEQMVSFLTIHDVMLLFYTLEALYALSDLGRYACDKIACVHGSIGILVSLLTLEPSDYGSSAEIKMKIVEILVPAEEDSEVQEKSAPAETPETPSSAVATPSLGGKDINSETFANNWLKSKYEACGGSTVNRNEMYAEYVSFCSKAGRKAVVNANVFANCIKNSFPQSELKKIQSGNGVIAFHHEGLRKKKIVSSPFTLLSAAKSPNPTVPVVSTPLLTKPATRPVLSPILKAQLSTPTRNEVVVTPKKQDVPIKSQPLLRPALSVSLPTSFMQGSQTVATSAQGQSTLIKSLLASKVQQRNVQRQVIPQGVSKMVIISPGKVSSLNPGSSAVVRCVVPGSLPQMNIRSPMQARMVGNKNCILASPTQVIHSNPVLQPKVFHQQTVIATSSAQLNGIKSDIQKEVNSTTLDSRGSGEVTHPQIIQMNCIQNHVSQGTSFPSGDISGDKGSLQSSKDKIMSAETNQNFILSQIHGNTVTYRLAGPNELPTSSGNRLFLRSKPSAGVLCPSPDQSGVFLNNKSAAVGVSLDTQSVIHPKINLGSETVRPVEEKAGDLRAIRPKEEICKKSPLLNGLLDKGKTSITRDILFNALVENGIEASDVGLDFPKSPSPPLHPKLLSTPSSLNSILIPTSSFNSIIIPASSLTSTILPLSSSSNTIMTSSVSAPSTTSVLSSSSTISNGANVVQIRTGQATFSGTAEVQPDQKGVVRLHIESPENSNQGSDLSSISDIARTLECASEAISRTNAECNTQVPPSSAPGAAVVGTDANGLVNAAAAVVGGNASTVAVGTAVNTSFAMAGTMLNTNVLTTAAGTLVDENTLTTVPGTSSASASVTMPGSVVNANTYTTMAVSGVNANTFTTVAGSVINANAFTTMAGNVINANTFTTVAGSVINANAFTTVAGSVINANAFTTVAGTLIGGNTSTLAGAVMETNSGTLTRHNQQFIVMAQPFNQPQLHLQSPNIKFCILHTVPIAEEGIDLVGVPQINLGQLQQSTLETPVSSVSLKRPSGDASPMCIMTNVKKPRVDSQTIHLSTSAPSTAAVEMKVISETSVVKSSTPLENSRIASKVGTSRPVSDHSMDLPNDKEVKVFSGLSSASGSVPATSACTVPATTSKSTSKLEYICEWKNCGLKFSNPGSVFLHVSKTHTPASNEGMPCLWEGCDLMKRKRFSLLTHLQDWHCNERVLRVQAMRRMQISQQGQTSLAPPPKPPPHPGYARDAAVLAIKRHALQYNNPKELSEEKESPLTKSIRLTSALILRNLVMHSSLARTYVRRFEQELAYIAMSPVESAKAVAQCLSHLSSDGKALDAF